MKVFLVCFVVFTCVGILTPAAFAQNVGSEGDPVPSIGPESPGGISGSVIEVGPRIYAAPLQKSTVPSALAKIDKEFEGFGFDDNPIENINPATGNGVRFIPPDPIGAAGKDRVIAVVNSMIESRNKAGQLKWREGIRDFFAPLSPTSFPFDPKIIYDQYKDRFVVVVLEQITGTASISPTNISRILLAVSKTGNPQTATPADWRFVAINSKTQIPRPVTIFDHWADYPGLATDEEAVYVTANMFTFVPFGSFGGARLWIVDKNGFYNGGAASVTVHDPYAIVGSVATTTQPAHVFGTGGAGSGIGTYLVSYSGLSDGVDEYVQWVRVDNPLGATTFTQDFINIGNIESFPGGLPDAPQPGVDLAGTSRTIEVNDRRALNAVWRNNALWMVAEIRPNSGTDLNQTTAHWWKLNTAGTIALDDQGNIGGEDIAPGTFTYFPAVAVNRDGHAKFGFSASAPTVYAGAYVTGRTASDPPGTVQASETVHAGEDFYFRRFGGATNRWGDYSGIAVDPSNDDFVWVFNEFADQRGTILSAFPTQDGRWGTAWGRSKFSGNAHKLAAAELLPAAFALEQNYPNPFNPSTVIPYALPEGGLVRVKAYNVLGQEVATLVDGYRGAGNHVAVFDSRSLASGVYFYKLDAQGENGAYFSSIKKMQLLK